MDDVEKLQLSISKELANVASQADEVWIAAPPIKAIDCVLSLNRNYDKMVWPRVKLFADANPSIQELSHLQAMIKQYPTPFEFACEKLDYRDKRRAQVLLGVVEFMMEAQKDHEGKTEEERLQNWAVWARPGDYLAVGVPGFGLAGFQYLRMLFGAQTTKPDVHIIRFVSDAIGRSVNDVQSLYLLEKAAKKLGLPLARLDSAIWNSRARLK